MGKKAAPKNRNGGTLSESGFWSFIRSGLRKKSQYWKPVTDCKLHNRRPYTGPNKRQKFEYQCNKCKNWFPEKEINVDHVKPAGSLNGPTDLPIFIEQLFCEEPGFQILCITCHHDKTQSERKSKKEKVMEEGLSKMDNEKPLDAEYIKPDEPIKPGIGFGGLGLGLGGLGLVGLLCLFDRNKTEDVDYVEVKDNLLNEKNE